MSNNSIFNLQFQPQPEKGIGYRSKSLSKNKPGENFQKVLAKDERGQHQQPSDQRGKVKEKPKIKEKGYENAAAHVDAAKREKKDKKVKTSVFNLSSAQEKEPVKETAEVESDALPISEISEEVRQGSLSALFKGYGSKEKLKAMQKEVTETGETTAFSPPPPEAFIAENTFAAVTPKKPQPIPLETEASPSFEKQPSKSFDRPQNNPPAFFKPKIEERPSQFIQESPDLSSVNPSASVQHTVPIQAADIQGAEESKPATPLHEVVDQIMETLYTLKREGSTDTIITLKHPPMLTGSKVVITAFDTAKGEFNLSFENLTQAAKQLLDAQENQNSLRFALEQKGFVVHILTTTTQSETQVLASSGENIAKDREGKGRDAREQQEGQEENEQ